MKTYIPHCMAIGLLLSCSMKEHWDYDRELDFSPPVLLEMDASGGPEIDFSFDEPVEVPRNLIILDNGIEANLEVREENHLILCPSETLEPGIPRTAELTVEDLKGNSNTFLIRFWGWNPEIPGTLINEFNPQGSGNNPDTIELYFTKGGNTAGMTLYYGTRNHFSYQFILPGVAVKQGDFLLVHCRPEGLSEEKDEIYQKNLSGGKLASDTAWDLWLPEDAGLSGSNGVLSIYDSPMGNPLDCVIYSDRESEPSDDKLGWTSATFDAVCDAYQRGLWDFSSEEISPSEAVRSEKTTGTRSLCRSSDSEDTDRNEDWHTVPTGEKSFGGVNTDEVYTP